VVRSALLLTGAQASKLANHHRRDPESQVMAAYIGGSWSSSASGLSPSASSRQTVYAVLSADRVLLMVASTHRSALEYCCKLNRVLEHPPSTVIVKTHLNQIANFDASDAEVRRVDCPSSCACGASTSGSEAPTSVLSANGANVSKCKCAAAAGPCPCQCRAPVFMHNATGTSNTGRAWRAGRFWLPRRYREEVHCDPGCDCAKHVKPSK
jgi:hypothetical protein